MAPEGTNGVGLLVNCFPPLPLPILGPSPARAATAPAPLRGTSPPHAAHDEGSFAGLALFVGVNKVQASFPTRVGPLEFTLILTLTITQPLPLTRTRAFSKGGHLHCSGKQIPDSLLNAGASLPRSLTRGQVQRQVRKKLSFSPENFCRKGSLRIWGVTTLTSQNFGPTHLLLP